MCWGLIRLGRRMLSRLKRWLGIAPMPKLPCECNWHLGMGPNLLCPAHGAETRWSYGMKEDAHEDSKG